MQTDWIVYTFVLILIYIPSYTPPSRLYVCSCASWAGACHTDKFWGNCKHFISGVWSKGNLVQFMDIHTLLTLNLKHLIIWCFGHRVVSYSDQKINCQSLCPCLSRWWSASTLCWCVYLSWCWTLWYDTHHYNTLSILNKQDVLSVDGLRCVCGWVGRLTSWKHSIAGRHVWLHF